MRIALAGLVRARQMLEMQLASHEAWQALRQLIERERKGDAVAAVDAARLRGGLEQRLDQDAPLWRIWAEIDAAIAQIDDVARGRDAWAPQGTVPVTAPGEARPLAAPLFEAPVAPATGPTPREVIRPRIKIKAASSVVVPVPPLTSPPETQDADPGAGTTGSPGADLSEATPSPPPAASLDRIRIIDRERFQRPSVPVEQRGRSDQAPPVVDAGGKPSPRSAKTTIAAASPPSGATPSAADPTDRLAALEADLDEIMGLPKTLDRQFATRRDDADDEPAGLQVEEADVSIVAIRRELLEPEAGPTLRSDPPSTPLVALSIRLKQEQHAAELDSDDYAAYLTDVGEADVEIVRFDPPAGEPRDATPPAGRPVLKVISRD